MTSLSLGTTYSFAVLAYNAKGDSDYTLQDVQATTSSEYPLIFDPPFASAHPVKENGPMVDYCLFCVLIMFFVCFLIVFLCVKRR